MKLEKLVFRGRGVFYINDEGQISSNTGCLVKIFESQHMVEIIGTFDQTFTIQTLDHNKSIRSTNHLITTNIIQLPDFGSIHCISVFGQLDVKIDCKVLSQYALLTEILGPSVVEFVITPNNKKTKIGTLCLTVKNGLLRGGGLVCDQLYLYDNGSINDLEILQQCVWCVPPQNRTTILESLKLGTNCVVYQSEINVIQ